jgi:acyl-CoA dehydrogenase
VHQVTLARQLLKDYKPVDGLFPSQHIPARLAAARAKYADFVEQQVAEL